MRKKITVTIGIILILFGVLLSTRFWVNNSCADSDNIVKIAIYPTGSMTGTYFIQLNTDNGKLSAEYGTRSMEDIDFSTEKFMIRKRGFDFEKDRVNLSADEVAEVINLLNAIYEDESCVDTRNVFDSWAVTIFYKNTVIENNRFQSSPKLKELINILLNKTNLEEDFSGFA